MIVSGLAVYDIKVEVSLDFVRGRALHTQHCKRLFGLGVRMIH